MSAMRAILSIFAVSSVAALPFESTLNVKSEVCFMPCNGDSDCTAPCTSCDNSHTCQPPPAMSAKSEVCFMPCNGDSDCTAPCTSCDNSHTCQPPPAVSAATDVILLATFDGAATTTHKWQETNDPVMGGRSTATFSVDMDKKVGIFNGTCAIVPKLKAPGFCNARTQREGGIFKPKTLPDVSAYIGGSLQLKVRSTTPQFKGFKVAFAAKDIPRTSIYGGQSFKAPFAVNGTDEQVVKVPFRSFSYDWSGFTGRCDTKDPNGKQHHCCTDDQPQYCPTAKFLASITDVELWAEGAEGDFHLEVSWIGAGN